MIGGDLTDHTKMNVLGRPRGAPLLGLSPQGKIRPGLEKSWAQIEAIAGDEQEHGNASSTKNDKCFRDIDSDPDGERAVICLYNSGHFRSPLRLRLGRLPLGDSPARSGEDDRLG